MSDDLNYWQRRTLGRRSLLRGAAIGGFGLAGAALIGCGGGEGGSSGGASGTQGGSAANTGGEQPQMSEAFVLIQTRDAVSLEPLDAQVYTVPERIGLVYPRLVYTELGSKDPTDIKWIPSYVVDGWEVQDGGKQMTFKLKKGVKYQNIAPLSGREFVASDVKFSIDRYMKNPKSTFQSRFEDVASIETPDNYTVVFKLKAPSRYFLTSLAAESALISPPEIEAEYKQKAIGPGPYIHEEYLQGEGSKLRKNPDFVNAKNIWFNRYQVKVITDAATRIAALKTGQADFNNSGGLTPSDVRTIEGPSVKLYPLLSASTQNIAWNMKNPKWADIRARKAMSKAFDRQALIDTTLQGAGKWTGVVPVDFGKWAMSEADVKNVDAYKYDVAEARKLWDAAGKPGMSNELFFSSNGTTGGVQAQFYAKQWQENLGIKTDVKTEDYSIFLPKSYNNGYPDMATVGYTIPNWMEHLFAPYLPGGTRNGSGINDPELIKMLADFRGTLDDAQAVEKSLKIQRYIQETALPMTQIPTAVSQSVHNAKLRNFVPGAYPPGMEWAMYSWKAK